MMMALVGFVVTAFGVVLFFDSVSVRLNFQNETKNIGGTMKKTVEINDAKYGWYRYNARFALPAYKNIARVKPQFFADLILFVRFILNHKFYKNHRFPNCQKATALAAATFSESTP